MQIGNNAISSYAELIQKIISASKPRFEKGSSPRDVAMVILEAITSDNPKTRYLVGQYALKMMEKRKNASDEEFRPLVVKYILFSLITP